MIRVLALGPRSNRITEEAVANWIKLEMGRCLGRMRRRHGGVIAMVSLAPGVGLWWGQCAEVYGAKIDSWAIHPDRFNGSHLNEYDAIISNSSEFRVTFPAEEHLEPWMYQEHLKQMAAVADIHVVVWDGKPDDYNVEALRSAVKPFYWIDPVRKRVLWHPDGDIESVGY